MTGTAVSHTNGNGNGTHTTQRLIFSIVAAGGTAALIAMAVFYVGFGRDYVSKSNLAAQINLYSPYAQDKAFIHEELARLDAEIFALRTTTAMDNAEDAGISARVAILEGTVNSLVKLFLRK